MDYKKACTVSNILFILSILLILAAMFLGETPQWTLWSIGVVTLFAGLGISVKYYRCPHCGIRLGRLPISKDYIPPFCPHCGSKLK